jgi:hypothetical protein
MCQEQTLAATPAIKATVTMTSVPCLGQSHMLEHPRRHARLHPDVRRGDARTRYLAAGAMDPHPASAWRLMACETGTETAAPSLSLPLNHQHLWDRPRIFPIGRVDLLDLPHLRHAIMLELRAAISDRAHVQFLLAQIDRDLVPGRCR